MTGVTHEDPWLTLGDAAVRIHVHPATLRRAIKRGQLRAARVGGRRSIRLRASWVDGWLDVTSTPVEMPR